jgi:hypothetical protein
MAVFSYDTAIKLPDLIKTRAEESRDFLNTVEAYSEILTVEGKTALMEEKVRTFENYCHSCNVVEKKLTIVELLAILSHLKEIENKNLNLHFF